jgi:hypothetical protein
LPDIFRNLGNHQLPSAELPPFSPCRKPWVSEAFLFRHPVYFVLNIFQTASVQSEETTSYDGDNSSGTDDLCAEMDDLLEENSGEEDEDESLPPVGAYNCRTTRAQAYKSPSPKKQLYRSPSPKKPSYRSPPPRKEAEKQIVYNIDMYRSMRHQKNRPTPTMTIVRREQHGPSSEDEMPYIPEKSARQKIQVRNDEL